MSRNEFSQHRFRWRHRTRFCRPKSCIRYLAFAALCWMFFTGWGSQVSRAEQPDFGVYARAVEYCRSVVKRPMTLDLDKRVLCFDGEISSESDYSRAAALEFDGLFVVRSFGGDGNLAMAMADFVRDRRATVVVYDYCLSACASFLLVASDQTFVMKDTIVAWHDIALPFCPALEAAKDGGPKRLQKAVCSDTPVDYQGRLADVRRQVEQFYETRIVDPLFQHPPESATIRRLLKGRLEGVGIYPEVLWTWNPRHYAGALRTKIIYEAYPASQEEVDALALKFGYPRRHFLYDP